MASPLRQRVPTWGVSRQPKLSLVPRRRRVAWFAVTVTVLVSAVMMGAALLHTRIAERQLEIDDLVRGVRTAQVDFDLLRAKRAELRSPTRVANRAIALGMTTSTQSEFVPVDPMLLAITIARTSEIPAGNAIAGSGARLDPLEQFRLVKSVGAEAP